ncbi:MAG: AsmA family protein [Bacteroidia bacterium]|nr:MAG: AsmA family protein [Bacteroidia bacterium]
MKSSWVAKLKICLYVFISVLIILILAGLALVFWVNPNHYKPLIQHIVKEQTGADIQISSISWEFFPNFGLQVFDLRLKTPNQLSNDPLISLARGDIALKLKSLLLGKIFLDKIILTDVQVNLINNGDKNNWQFTNRVPYVATKSYIYQLSQIKLNNVNIKYSNLMHHKVFEIPHFSFVLKKGSDGSINYIPKIKMLHLSNVNYIFNEELRGKINFSYLAGNYSGNITTNTFSINSFLTGLGFRALSRYNATPWQNVSFISKLAGHGRNLQQLIFAPLNLGSSKIQLNANISSIKPLKMFTKMQVDQLEVSDFVKINNYKLKLKGVITSGVVTLSNNTFFNQNLYINDLIWYGYDVHRLSLQIASIVNNPFKIISIPYKINQIKAGIINPATKGRKNYHLVSDLGALRATLKYNNHQLAINSISLNGKDVRIYGNLNLNTSNDYLRGNLNAQFVAPPNTLHSKIRYPIKINGSKTIIDWNSINKQIYNNIASSIKNMGNSLGKIVESKSKKLGRKIKSWF